MTATYILLKVKLLICLLLALLKIIEYLCLLNVLKKYNEISSILVYTLILF